MTIGKIERDRGANGPRQAGMGLPSFSHINNSRIVGDAVAKKFSHLIRLHAMKLSSIGPDRAIELKGLAGLILRDIAKAEIPAEALPNILTEIEVLRTTGIFSTTGVRIKVTNPVVLDCLKEANETLGKIGSQLKPMKAMPKTSTEPGIFRRMIDLSGLFKPRPAEIAQAMVEKIAEEPTKIEAVPAAEIPTEAPAVPETPRSKIDQLREDLRIPEKRYEALKLMEEMKTGIEEALPELIDIISMLVKDLNGKHNLERAINLLWNIGPAAKDALPRLKEMLMNTKMESYTFLVTCIAISRIDSNPAAVYRDYLRLLDRPYENRKDAAKAIMRQFYVNPESVAESLRDEAMLVSQRRLIMREFIKQIDYLTDRDSPDEIRSRYKLHFDLIVPAVRELLESPDLELTEIAAIALRRLGRVIAPPA